MKYKIITLTTDMGWEYASQMKGMIISINPDVNVIDITHSISPQKILEGAFILYSAVEYFPPAIHVGVVDPGVGTARKEIIVECDKGILIGPDNGLLIPAARKLGIGKVYEIPETKKASPTFHGRDIFAPVAAKISLGEKPSKIGNQIDEFEEISFGEPIEIKDGIKGKIIFIDKFGNLITNIPKEKIDLKYGEWVKIKMKNEFLETRFLKSYGYAKEKKFLVTVSSSNFYEISLNRGNASKFLGASIEDEIIFYY